MVDPAIEGPSIGNTMEQMQNTDDIFEFVLLGPGDVVVNINNNNSLESVHDLENYKDLDLNLDLDLDLDNYTNKDQSLIF